MSLLAHALCEQVEQQRETKLKIASLNKRMDLLRAVLSDLEGTRHKWIESRNRLSEKRRTLEGDTMVFAVMAGFGGVLSRERRSALLRDCMAALASADIAYSGTCNVLSIKHIHECLTT